MECNQKGSPNNNQWHLQKSEIMVLFKNDHSLSATIFNLTSPLLESRKKSSTL